MDKVGPLRQSTELEQRQDLLDGLLQQGKSGEARGSRQRGGGQLPGRRPDRAMRTQGGGPHEPSGLQCRTVVTQAWRDCCCCRPRARRHVTDASGMTPPVAAGHALRARQSRLQSVAVCVPAVKLVRDDGREVSLPEEMNDGRPVLLNFIFTSCGSTCPLMSQVFAAVSAQAGCASHERAPHVDLDRSGGGHAGTPARSTRTGSAPAQPGSTTRALWRRARRAACLRCLSRRQDESCSCDLDARRPGQPWRAHRRAGDSRMTCCSEYLQLLVAQVSLRSISRARLRCRAGDRIVCRMRATRRPRARASASIARAADRYRAAGARPARP